MKGQIRSVMVERKSVVAHIHEWEENRAKGKREEGRGKKKEYARVEMEAVNTE